MGPICNSSGKNVVVEDKNQAEITLNDKNGLNQSDNYCVMTIH